MATNAPQTKHVKLDIKRMTCAACSASVERALRRVDGVLQVNVNLATNSATVLCDPSVSEQMLVEIAVEGGARVEGKTLQEIRLPGRALVVCVRRGDQDMIPQADTVLLGGDYVYLIPNHARLHQLNELFKTKTGE